MCIWYALTRSVLDESYSAGTITGIYSGWGSYLEPNLETFLPSSRAQSESGWIGFYGTLAGCLGGIGFGLTADVFSGRMKVCHFGGRVELIGC